MNTKKQKKNGIVYLKINVSPSLYATSASIEVGEIKNPWSGYPEPIIYNPPLEFDDDGVPKVDIKFRRQKSAIVPIAYLTDDLNQDGESLTFGQGGKGSQRTLVRSLCGNLMMFSFELVNSAGKGWVPAAYYEGLVSFYEDLLLHCRHLPLVNLTWDELEAYTKQEADWDNDSSLPKEHYLS